LCCHTKVGQLDFARLGEENVCGFDVTMYLSLCMEIFQTGKKLAADDGYVCFAEARGLGFELAGRVR
jgi:hypothetical protein